MKDVSPALFAILPFAAVFGALAVNEGFTLLEVMVASGLIFAGSSQYAMLELWGGVPAWAIILTVFLINFRHVLYSAALGRRLSNFSFLSKYVGFFLLTDLSYGASELRSRRGLTPTYYFVYCVWTYIVWMLGNFLGALFGPLLDDPARFGLDFILPLYFCWLMMAFRQTSNFFFVFLVSGLVSLLAWFFLGSPWHIMSGGFCGLLTASILSSPPDSESENPNQ